MMSEIQKNSFADYNLKGNKGMIKLAKISRCEIKERLAII